MYELKHESENVKALLLTGQFSCSPINSFAEQQGWEN
jgi:hypothetical protein